MGLGQRLAPGHALWLQSVSAKNPNPVVVGVTLKPDLETRSCLGCSGLKAALRSGGAHLSLALRTTLESGTED